MRELITILAALFILTGCMEIDTTDPNDSFKYWAGTYPPDNLQIIHGQYWQSSHWTKEYMMYLKLKPTKEWWDKFIDQNHLQIDKNKWIKSVDAPNWFNPTDNSIKYSSGYEFDQGSRYFRDSLTEVCYIYEIQL